MVCVINGQYLLAADSLFPTFDDNTWRGLEYGISTESQSELVVLDTIGSDVMHRTL